MGLREGTMRRFFVYFGAVLMFSAAATQTGASAKTRTCQPVSPVAEQCIVGVDTTLIANKTAYQATAVWCWAASIQMVFARYNHIVSQQDVVRHALGAVVVTTASDMNIDQALSGTYSDTNGNNFDVSYTDIPTYGSLATVVGALENDDPLLVLTSHHVMMLSALTWVDGTGPGGVVGSTTGAIVRDPWPQPQTYQGWNMGPGRRVMTLPEFMDIRRTLQVTVTDD
jgi:Papain-like cysteine protease AvrRpt2